MCLIMIEIGSLRKAVYDFHSENDQELSLHVGDIVQVLEWVDKQWCLGICHATKGNFPPGFTIDLKVPPLEENQSLFAAFTDFEAQELGDLSFKKGDLIVGLCPIDNNWWEGRCNNKQGIFPITHVWEVNRSFLAGASGPQKVFKKAKVKMNLKAQLKEEMDLYEGDIVVITEEVDKGWYRGECNGKTGIFPSSFVTIIPNDVESLESLPTYDTVTKSLDKPSLVLEGADDSSNQYGYDCLNSGITAYGRSVHPFTSESPNELTFCEGEIINLLRHVDDNYMEGEIDGRIGIFPKGFINIIVDCPVTITKDSESSLFPNDTYGRVIHDFHPQNEAYASLIEGDTITLLRQINKGFYEVQTDKDVTYVCPMSCIEVIGNGPDLLPPSYSEVIQDDRNSLFDLETGDHILYHGSSRTDRPISYPSAFCDQSSIPNWNDSNVKISQSINGKIAENLASLDSVTSKVNSSPNLAHRSYSLSSESSSFLNDFKSDFRPSAVTVKENDHSAVYENLDGGSTDPWLFNEGLRQSTIPTRPPPPKKNSSYDGNSALLVFSSDNSRNFISAGNTVGSSSQEAASPRCVGAKKQENEEKKCKEERKKKMKEQRACVITEIVQTERDYISDLQILFDIFMKDTEQAKNRGIDVGTLFGNLDEVIDVASRLVCRLKKVANASCQSQTIGQCFVDMSDDLKEVYGHYCRNHDDVNAVLDKYDEKSPAGLYLKHKVELMKRQTNCFDLPSMLIKPVQRILKYPLLLNELVKCTEDSHPDKQSLIEAIGLMTDVATAINEFKRRKDLVFKYRKHADTSLSGRISKFSIHSMLKKSSRFGMRLSNSIGLTHMTKDEGFAKIESQFHTLEKSIKIFMKDITLYMEKTEESVKTAFRIAEDIAELYQERKSQQEVDQFRSVHRIIATQFWEANKQVMDRNVFQILKQLLQTFHGPINLIEKRYDKLLDYEACSNKLEKNKDVLKIKMLQDNLQKAKNTYEALNSQLLDDLPKLYSMSVEILHDCICCFLKAKKNFIGKSAREMLSLTELPLLLGSQSGTLETFHVKHTLVMDNLCLLSIVPKHLFSASKTATLKRNSSPGIVRLGFGAASQSGLQLKQGTGDQVFVKSTYPIEQQYFACESYDAVDLLDLSLRQGDVVGVIKQQDPMGNRLRWFVDKGSSKGFVPAKFLQKSIESLGNVATKASNLQPDYSVVDKKRVANEPITGHADFSSSENRCQPVRPAPPIGFSKHREPLPKSTPSGAVILHNVSNSSTSQDSPIHRYEEIDELFGHYDSVNQEVPITCQPSVPAMSLEEFDPYGPTRIQAQLYDNVPNGEGQTSIFNEHRYETIPEDVVLNASEYYYALFDFIPRGGNQLQVTKGQVVLVLHKWDLNQNSEWWFVEDRHGNKGYVPANYLNSYPGIS